MYGELLRHCVWQGELANLLQLRYNDVIPLLRRPLFGGGGLEMEDVYQWCSEKQFFILRSVPNTGRLLGIKIFS